MQFCHTISCPCVSSCVFGFYLSLIPLFVCLFQCVLFLSVFITIVDVFIIVRKWSVMVLVGYQVVGYELVHQVVGYELVRLCSIVVLALTNVVFASVNVTMMDMQLNSDFWIHKKIKIKHYILLKSKFLQLHLCTPIFINWSYTFIYMSSLFFFKKSANTIYSKIYFSHPLSF